MKHLILLALVACGDNTPAPPDALTRVQTDAHSLLWREAYAVWFDAWCFAAERCNPLGFSETFQEHDECVTRQVGNFYCNGADSWCNSKYPDERLGLLTQCHAATLVIACDAHLMPDVCWEALK